MSSTIFKSKLEESTKTQNELNGASHGASLPIEYQPASKAIHPLFRPNAFRNCRPTIVSLNWSDKPRVNYMRHRIHDRHYCRLVGAIRHATTLLYQARPFLVKIAYADPNAIDEDADISELPAHNTSTTILSKEYKASAADVAALDTLLTSLSLCIFKAETDPSTCSFPTATCTPLLPYFSNHMHIKCSPERPPVAITLSTKIFNFFTQSETKWRYASAEVKRHCESELPIALVREVARAVWQIRVMKEHGMLLADTLELDVPRTPNFFVFREIWRDSRDYVREKLLKSGALRKGSKASSSQKGKQRAVDAAGVVVHSPPSSLSSASAVLSGLMRNVWQEPLTCPSEREADLARDCERYLRRGTASEKPVEEVGGPSRCPRTNSDINRRNGKVKCEAAPP